MKEEWRPVLRGVYEVSSLGKIRRAKADRMGRDYSVGQELKPWSQRGGYLQVRLSVAGKTRTFCVHQLVAKAFLGARPIGKQINHIDGDKRHNASSNLEYVTAKQNTAHAFKLGLRICRAGGIYARN